MNREELGRMVRDVWVAWAREQPAPKASWLAPWEQLSEPDREVDRRIGEALAGSRSLATLQREIDARWGSSAYGPAYLARRDPQRDAHHALLHVTKAAGKIAGALDDLDHAKAVVPTATTLRSGGVPGTYLADLVICAVRIASEWPGARIDLGAAVAERLASKFPPAKPVRCPECGSAEHGAAQCDMEG